MKNYTEIEYNKLPIRLEVDKIIIFLGLDKTKWYFGEATEGDDYFNVYFSNLNLEDHALNFDFNLIENKWVLERAEITQD